MASPFSIFRKNQKVLLAVFGVAIIISFTIGGIISKIQRAGGRGGREDKVAVRWKHGDLTDSELFGRRQTRLILVDLFAKLQREAYSRDATFQPKERGVGPTPDQERAVVQSLVLAKRAEQLGMTVSDDAIFDYLRKFTGGILDDENDELDRSVFQAILTEAAGGRISPAGLREALRQEILAQKMEQVAIAGFGAIPPADVWEQYKRLNRRIRVELLPVEVDDFLARVKENPTGKQIKELYEKHKNDYPNPNFSEPGFKRRRAVSFGYVQADYNKFLEAEKAKTTREQIRQYYEDHKDDFRKPDLPSEEDAVESGAGETSDDDAPGKVDSGDANSDLKAPTGNKDEEAAPDAAGMQGTSDASETPADDEAAGQPDETEASDEAAESNDENDAPMPGEDTATEDGTSSGSSDEVVPLNDDPSDTEPKENVATPNNVGDDDDDDAADDEAGNSSDTDAVTAEDDVEEAAAGGDDDVTDGSEEAAADDDDDAADDEAGDSSDTDAVTAEGDSDHGTDGSEEAAAEAEGESERSADKQASEDLLLGETDADGDKKEPEYKPLEDVEDEIRQSLAANPAQKAMDALLTAVGNEVQEYQNARVEWMAGAREKEPQPLAAKALAKKHQLAGGSIPLVGPFEITEKYDLGSSVQKARTSEDPTKSNYVPFTRIGFRPELREYDPQRSRGGGMGEQWFVFWKTGERDEFVPDLKDVRDEVIRASKLEKARRLAQTEAEDMAKKASAAGVSLKDKYGTAAIETDEFSYYSPESIWMFRIQGQPLRLNQIEGVVGVDDDFMQAVFSLSEGEIAAIPNGPQTLVYLVRLVSMATPENDLRERFMDSVVSMQPGQKLPPDLHLLAMDQRRRLMREWYLELEEEMGIEWEREAKQFAR